MTKKEINADKIKYQKKLIKSQFKRFIWFITVFITLYLILEFYDLLFVSIPLLAIQFFVYSQLKKLHHNIKLLKLCITFLEAAEDPSDKSKVEEVAAIFRKN